MDTEPNK